MRVEWKQSAWTGKWMLFIEEGEPDYECVCLDEEEVLGLYAITSKLAAEIMNRRAQSGNDDTRVCGQGG